MFWLLSCGNIW